MAIRWFKCTTCNEEYRSKNQEHTCGSLGDVLLTAPQAKMMERVSATSNRSALVDQKKILKARARAHSRETALEELVATNNLETSFKNQWLNEDGRVRKKIDDI